MKLHKIGSQLLLIAFVAFVLTMQIGPAQALGERTLKPGAAGEDVKQLQTALYQKGLYAGSVDGVFGEETRSAVTALQEGSQLNADGVAGKATIEVLKRNTEAARSSAPDRYGSQLAIVATAYAPGAHDNGNWGNKTYLGTNIRPGVIAVDPKVIPLGSKVYIEFADGHGVYATAEDTGGAIKGNRIDIAMWSVEEAYTFGMQNVKVFILN